jgi:hypothetical protein
MSRLDMQHPGSAAVLWQTLREGYVLTFHVARKYVARFYSVLLLICALRVILKDPDLWHIFFAAVLIFWAFGLFQQRPSALKFTGAICLLPAIFVPMGVFNPFAAMDSVSFPIYSTLLWLVPLELLALTSAYVLDRPDESSREA